MAATRETFAATRLWRDTAPPWVVSLLFHAVLLAVLALIGWTVTRRPDPPVLVELGVGGGRGGSPVGAGVGDGEGMGESGSSPQGTRQTATASTEVVDLTAGVASLDPDELVPDSSISEAHLQGDYGASDPAMALVKGLAGLGGDGADVGTGHGPGGGGGGLGGTGGGFQRLVRQMRVNGLDVVLVIDATNSMAPYIEQAKQRLRQIVGVVTGLIGTDTKGKRRSNVRFGIVAYKDYGDEFGLDATESLPLSDDVEKVRQFIDGVTAGGGGDDPEPIHEALRAAAEPAMGWRRGRTSVIVLVGDAPVHAVSRKDAFERAKEFAVKQRGTINVIDVGGTGADAPRNTVLGDLASIAQAGGGTAFLLRDEQRFWRHLIVSIFGQQFEQDVETIVERYGGEP